MRFEIPMLSETHRNAEPQSVITPGQGAVNLVRIVVVAIRYLELHVLLERVVGTQSLKWSGLLVSQT